MTVQAVQSNSSIRRETASLIPDVASMNQTASNTTQSSWKKFSWDTTSRILNGSVDVDAELGEFYEQINVAWNLGRYDEVLKGLDVILEKHLPAAGDLVRAVLLTMKAKCYEESERFDEALDMIEQALFAVKKHEDTVGSFFEDRSNDIANPIRFLEIRKAALLLLTGKEEAGFESLKNHQPTQVSGALLYHLLEKRSGRSLLELQPTEKKDLKSLFMAGEYEEILEKTANLPEKPTFCFDDSEYRIRAAALAMTGRIEEALSLYDEKQSYAWRPSESENIYQLIRALKGEKNIMGGSINGELETGVPLALFLKWAANA